jgi:hypothetical protein
MHRSRDALDIASGEVLGNVNSVGNPFALVAATGLRCAFRLVAPTERINVCRVSGASLPRRSHPLCHAHFGQELPGCAPRQRSRIDD